jgi:hypothetical protein
VILWTVGTYNTGSNVGLVILGKFRYQLLRSRIDLRRAYMSDEIKKAAPKGGQSWQTVIGACFATCGASPDNVREQFPIFQT